MHAVVATLDGPIDATSLGMTLMHEHIFVRSPDVSFNYTDSWQSDEIRVADAAAKLRAAYETGVRSIVDLTVVGLGRDIRLMKAAATGTGVNVIAATGMYVLNELPYQLQFTAPDQVLGGPDQLTEWFIRDIVEGIAGTGIRAGAIKCATDVPGVTSGVARVMSAAAEASIATGVPILTHADAGTRRGLDQQAYLGERGVDLTNIVIGHAGDTTDLDYLRAMMDAGSSIGMDRFGLETALDTAARIRVVAQLCREGYADRMVLSHDTACHNEWMNADALAEKLPDWDYTFIPRQVVPAMLESGVSPEDIDQMLIGNPSRILAGVAASEKNS